MKTAAAWYSEYIVSEDSIYNFIEKIQEDTLKEAADKATARIIQETINGGKKAVVNRESILSLIKK